MIKKLHNKLQRGQSLVELLIAIGLAAILLPAILTGLIASREGKAQQWQRLEATALVKEMLEATRSIREKDWTAFAVNGTFHPAVSENSWTLAAGQEVINGYTKEVVISDVERDINGAIVTSAGVFDPSTKKVIARVSWNTPFPSSIETVTYLTRHLNTSFTQTTTANFNTGTKTNVTITNTDDGEVTLGAGTSADWCQPNLSITALDLPKNGVANAISAIEGKVFAGTGDNASGVSFANVTVSSANPPVGQVAGTFDGFKTNGVFGEANYAYLATDTNTKEVVIIDLDEDDNEYEEAGYFDAPGNGSGSSVYVSGSIGYMTNGNKLYNFDLSSKQGSRPLLDADGVTLAATATKVVVVGNYAYVAIADTSTQLQIVDIGNPSNLAVVGQASIDGREAKDIFVNNQGTRAYLAAAQSPTKKELFIIDATTKTGNLPILGSYETTGMDPKGVTVVPGNRAIIVGVDGEEYQVVSLSDETAPSRCGGLQIDTGINGVSSVLETDGDAYSYIITGDASTELKIIEGGGAGQYGLSGVFESSTLDAGKEVVFNSFTATATIPPLTALTYQVAASDANAQNGDCSNATFNFVGPDGTGNSYFATGSAILLDNDNTGFENPGRCFRYKAFLSTNDAMQSPVLYDIHINYSL